MDIEKRFLPIGTVLLLKNGNKKIMITSYGTFSKKEPKKVYEYGACLYPEGILNGETIYAFNHDDIEKIFYMGYTSDEQVNFCNALEKDYEKIKSAIENSN